MSKIYALVCDGEVDQFCETEKDMKRERKWLQKQGFRVTVKVFDNWKDAEEYEDKLRGY